MSEHLRALLVILFLAAPAYLLTRLVLAPMIGQGAFRRRWLAWFLCTLVLFLAHNAWLYVLGTALLAGLFMRHESNPMALFAMLFLVAPPMLIEIPGFGVVNYLVQLDHTRLLALSILLPAAFRLRRDPLALSFGRLWMDRVLALFLVYTTMMALRETTLTDTLRAAVYAVIDVGLVYFVASRTMTNLRATREVLASLVTIAVLMCLVAIFETGRSWLLYSAVPNALQAQVPIGGYLLRDGLLRAMGTAGQSLALGYFLVVALCSWLFLSGYVRQPVHRLILSVTLGVGLLASLARAPWVAAALVYLLHSLTLPRPSASLLRRGLVLAGSALIVMLSPMGSRVVDMLPYVGKVDAFNVEYRERLLDAALRVIERNPLLGSVTYLDTPEMQAMIQGQGIIDIVNSYLGIALEYGLFGLSQFIALLLIAFGSAWKLRSSAAGTLAERSLAGTMIVALLAIALLIYTVSSITVIPWIYWWVLGSMAALPAIPRSAATPDLVTSRRVEAPA